MAFFNPLKRLSENALPDGRQEKKSPAKKPADETRAAHSATIRLSDAKKGGEQFAGILKKPRVTEKASFVTEDGAYTFEVMPGATKQEIKKAVAEAYGVTPTKVNTLPIRSKRVFYRGRARGVSQGGKKAVVYLKKGERIEFI